MEAIVWNIKKRHDFCQRIFRLVSCHTFHVLFILSEQVEMLTAVCFFFIVVILKNSQSLYNFFLVYCNVYSLKFTYIFWKNKIFVAFKAHGYHTVMKLFQRMGESVTCIFWNSRRSVDICKLGTTVVEQSWFLFPYMYFSFSFASYHYTCMIDILTAVALTSTLMQSLIRRYII